MAGSTTRIERRRRSLTRTLCFFLAAVCLCVQRDLSPAILSQFVLIMGDLASHCTPLPAVLLDEVLRQFTPDVQAENPNGAALAIQLLHKYRDVFERPVQLFFKETLVDKAEGQQAWQQARGRARRRAASHRDVSLLCLACLLFPR